MLAASPTPRRPSLAWFGLICAIITGQTIIILILSSHAANSCSPSVTAMPSDSQHHNITLRASQSGPQGSAPSLNGRTACLANPFKDSVNRTFDDIIRDARRWLDEQPHYSRAIAGHSNYTEHDHRRFFPFEVMAPCNDFQCVGGKCSVDQSKIVCGLNHLQKLDRCVVYSIGGNNRWEFELDVLERTRCRVHTFDCTGPRRRFNLPDGHGDRLNFHYMCLGARSAKGVGEGPVCKGKQLCGETWTLGQIQRHLGHDQIDLIKLDIEGWEWPIFDIESTDAWMPMQVLMEVHYGWISPEVMQKYGRNPRLIEAISDGTQGVRHSHGTFSAGDLVRLQGNLLRMGYAVANRDDNPSCRHCSELTLMRVAC